MNRALMLVLVVSVVSTAMAADPSIVKFPIKVTDPVRDQPVSLKPDSSLLHLVFLATWCPPCMDELPQLGELEARWRGAGYRLVLVAVPTRQTPERLRDFIASESPPGELVLDHTSAAMRATGTARIPAHVLVTADGKVVHHAENLADGIEAAVEDFMEARARGED